MSRRHTSRGQKSIAADDLLTVDEQWPGICIPSGKGARAMSEGGSEGISLYARPRTFFAHEAAVTQRGVEPAGKIRRRATRNR